MQPNCPIFHRKIFFNKEFQLILKAEWIITVAVNSKEITEKKWVIDSCLWKLTNKQSKG